MEKSVWCISYLSGIVEFKNALIKKYVIYDNLHFCI